MTLEDYMNELGMQIYIERGPADSIASMSINGLQFKEHYTICYCIRGRQLFINASDRIGKSYPKPSDCIQSFMREYKIFENIGATFDAIIREFPKESPEWAEAAYQNALRMKKFLEGSLSPDEINKLGRLCSPMFW